MMAATSDSSITVYELLPNNIKEQDQAGIIKGFMEAVQSEYERNKSSITGIMGIVSPQEINKNFVLAGNPVFFHPEQFVVNATATLSTINLTGSPSAVAGSGFYTDFGVYVWADPTTPAAVGQYRKIISYDGTTKVAQVDFDWLVTPSSSAVYAFCWPDRVWLPTAIVSDPRKPGGTIFPDQVVADYVTVSNALGIDPGLYPARKIALLPGLAYLASVENYYVGWTLDFLDGTNAGLSIKIAGHRIAFGLNIIILETSMRDLPDANDWWRLTPPTANQTSNVDNFYKDRWISVNPPNTSAYPGQSKTQYLQILRSTYDPTATPASHIAYVYDPVSGDGSIFQFPPSPVADYGILTTYIPLQHLAHYVGIDIDERDNEIYQRLQIQQAYNYHKLKGTKRAIELICKSFGLEVLVDEAASNYTPAPNYEDTELSAAQRVGHRQFAGSTVSTLVKQGLGVNDVPTSYLTAPGNMNARIPDSDIRLFLSRSATAYNIFSQEIVDRVVYNVSQQIPIHVQIIFVGLLTTVQEFIDVSETLLAGVQILNLEEIAADEDFFMTPLGTVPYLDSYTVSITSSLALSTDARYSRAPSARFSGRNGIIPAPSRWSRGTTATVS